MSDTEQKPKCRYCGGEGFYITYTFGLKEKHFCRFCNGTGDDTWGIDKKND